MPHDATIRWTVSVSRDTDTAVRTLLAQRRMKKGDFSRFIEDAVKWRVLDQTLTEARDQFTDMAPEALEALIDEALIDEAVTASRRRGALEAG
jgi:hypothetical protein